MKEDQLDERQRTQQKAQHKTASKTLNDFFA